MFYFDEINSKKILKSDLISEAEVFFTTKESFIKTKEESLKQLANENKNLICNYLKINPNNLLHPKQVHGDNIEFVTKNKKEYPQTDALILNNTTNAIYLNFADCTPVVLYDFRKNIIAIAHAGWRGTVLKIAAKTISKMNSNPQDIKALIGPNICFNCFETSEEIALELKKTLINPDGLFLEKNGKYYADLKGVNARQLYEAGVKEVDICPYCTYCNNDLFFSYRKENKTTSRISAVAKLK